MAKPYSLAVFDWEGTLGDTLGLILNTLGMVAESMGLDKPDQEKTQSCAGYGLVIAIRKLYPELSADQQQSLLNAVQLTLMKRHEDVFLFPGALELIQKLHERHITLAVATNRGEKSLQRALQQTGLAPYFSVTRSAGQTAAKPDPEMLEEILDVCGIAVEDALMVGDSSNDMEMAASIGMHALGVDFYHQQRETLMNKGALAVFDNYNDVYDFILQRTFQEKK